MTFSLAILAYLFIGACVSGMIRNEQENYGKEPSNWFVFFIVLGWPAIGIIGFFEVFIWVNGALNFAKEFIRCGWHGARKL